MNEDKLKYICTICKDILKYPVTTPCKHTFCKECLDHNFEENKLVCPLCRRILQSWLRRVRKDNNIIVNQEMWEKIKKIYPNRSGGKKGEDNEEGGEDEEPLSRILAKPGEIRKYYEECLNKEREERRKEEEDNYHQSEYIIKMIEEDNQKEEVERLKQLKHDEELARSLLDEDGPETSTEEEEARLRQLRADEELARLLASTASRSKQSPGSRLGKSKHGPSVKTLFEDAVRKRAAGKEKLSKRKDDDTDDTDSLSYDGSESFQKALLPRNDDIIFLGPVGPPPLDTISLSSAEDQVDRMSVAESLANIEPSSSDLAKDSNVSELLPEHQNMDATAEYSVYSSSDSRFRQADGAVPSTSKDGVPPPFVIKPQASGNHISDITTEELEIESESYLAKLKQEEEDRLLAEALEKRWNDEERKRAKKIVSEYNLRPPKEKPPIALRGHKRKRSSGNARKKVLVDRTQSTLDSMLVNCKSD